MNESDHYRRNVLLREIAIIESKSATYEEWSDMSDEGYIRYRALTIITATAERSFAALVGIVHLMEEERREIFYDALSHLRSLIKESEEEMALIRQESNERERSREERPPFGWEEALMKTKEKK